MAEMWAPVSCNCKNCTWEFRHERGGFALCALQENRRIDTLQEIITPLGVGNTRFLRGVSDAQHSCMHLASCPTHRPVKSLIHTLTSVIGTPR